MWWMLLACEPTPGAADPSVRARGKEDGPVILGTDSDGEETPPTDGSVREESDRTGTSGLLGSEKTNADGDRKVFVRRVGVQITTELVVSENLSGGWSERVLISGVTMPERPAISPDGETIAFTSGISGLASIWVMPFVGGADPVQITNVGLQLKKRAPGQPPPGFLPPPIDESLRFEGDDLLWNGPDGPQVARWR